MNFRAFSSVCPVLLVVLLSAACGGDSPSSSTPLPSAPFSQTDLVVGTGSSAANGRSLTVFYTLWLYDPAGAESKGRQIQSNVGMAPYGPFTLGVGSVIRGWDIGVVGMSVGGKRRLIIPPDLAYGASGRPPEIPGGATLVFDIELVSVQ